jgi:transcriptional repressor NrdR
MNCPYCQADTFVVDSRNVESGMGTRRRRECSSCAKRFTTYERAEYQLVVVKRDGTRERFERDKLLRGMFKACEKRPVRKESVEEIADRIEKEIRNQGVPEMTSKRIGNTVMRELLKLDQVAYIRFRSVYNKFDTPRQFVEAASSLGKKKR